MLITFKSLDYSNGIKKQHKLVTKPDVVQQNVVTSGMPSFGYRIPVFLGQISLNKEQSSSKSLSPAKQALFNSVDNHKSELINLADDIFQYKELSQKEFKSCERLAKTLEDSGFEVKRKVAGLETAFEATYVNNNADKKGPVIGILAEYDALPNGHSCCHQLIASSAASAAIALKEALGNVPATIKVFGTPAEETVGGKIDMVREGCFKDCDVTLTTHAATKTSAANRYLALQRLSLAFNDEQNNSGNSSITTSALQNVMDFLNAMYEMRKNVTSDVKLHGIINNVCGQAVNIIPEQANISLNVQSADRGSLDNAIEKLTATVNDVASKTQTTVSIKTTKSNEDKNAAIEIVYKGKAVHAAKHLGGADALEAAVSLFNGINNQKNSLPEDTKLKFMITDNFEKKEDPKSYGVEFAVRSKEGSTVKQLIQQFKTTAEKVSQDNKITVTSKPGRLLDSNLVVQDLSDLFIDNAKLAGVEEFSEPITSASSDFGNVSKAVPSALLHIATMPEGTTTHSDEWVKEGTSDKVHDTILKASKAMATTAYDLITDRSLLDKIKQDFENIKEPA